MNVFMDPLDFVDFLWYRFYGGPSATSHSWSQQKRKTRGWSSNISSKNKLIHIYIHIKSKFILSYPILSYPIEYNPSTRKCFENRQSLT